jgi:uncharacterized membrane protein YgdD (TMEM256/DUF423 family)
MTRLWLGLGAAYGLSGVALGAVGTHALADGFDAGALAAYDTAVRYQLLHALALVGLAALAGRGLPERCLRLAGWCFAAGTLLFSGALYARALLGAPLFLPIAPVGGVLLMLGWAFLLSAAFKRG